MSLELILPFLRPIEPFLLDKEVSEIMGDPDSTWYVEREGRMHRQATVSFDSGSLRTGLEVIANHLGKRLDEDNPRLQAQLPDGSRIAAWIPPLVNPAPALSIRKFTSRHFTMVDLIARGMLTQTLAELLTDQIRSGKTLLIMYAHAAARFKGKGQCRSPRRSTHDQHHRSCQRVHRQHQQAAEADRERSNRGQRASSD
jgi:pilus assembly protein CpaF